MLKQHGLACRFMQSTEASLLIPPLRNETVEINSEMCLCRMHVSARCGVAVCGMFPRPAMHDVLMYTEDSCSKTERWVVGGRNHSGRGRLAVRCVRRLAQTKCDRSNSLHSGDSCYPAQQATNAWPSLRTTKVGKAMHGSCPAYEICCRTWPAVPPQTPGSDRDSLGT